MKKKNALSRSADITSLCQNLVTFMDESKAENIVTIDLHGKSSIADYLVISSSLSARHMKTLAEKLKEELHRHGVDQVKCEGLGSPDWVLIDAGDIIIHLFRPEVRDIYNLEKMWSAPFSQEESA